MNQMELALEASYDGVVDVDLGFGYTAERVMRSSSIRIIVYGGSTSGIEELTGFDGFMSIISASTEFSATSPGVPILYKFRHLRDNTLAMISLTSQYTIVRPLKIRQGVRVTVNRYICEWSDDDDTSATPTSTWTSSPSAATPSTGPAAAMPGCRSTRSTRPCTTGRRRTATRWRPARSSPAGTSIDLTFNTEDYDFNYAKIGLSAFARDYDWGTYNEEIWGSLNIFGNAMLGSQNIMLYASDSRFRVECTVELINRSTDQLSARWRGRRLQPAAALLFLPIAAPAAIPSGPMISRLQPGVSYRQCGCARRH
ncbi:MAG: thiol-activated cytolysin family protein [bacterium]|nr:thiol-activated cytolysin family protein [bacterium]